jgi:hypothetical protein
MKGSLLALFLLFSFTSSFAQHSDESKNLKDLGVYQDSLKALGKRFINDPDDLERKNANYKFIKLLVGALKVPIGVRVADTIYTSFMRKMPFYNGVANLGFLVDR